MTEPTRASASPPNTRDGLIGYLHSLPAGHIISGQHNREPSATYRPWDPQHIPSADMSYYNPWTDKAAALTGYVPGLWGGDFLYDAPFTEDSWRGVMIEQAVAQAHAGSLVTLSWHMTPPNVFGSRSTTWSGSDQSVDISGGTGYWRLDSTWTGLLDAQDRTPLYANFITRLNEAVPFFQVLQQEGIPVLFRPFHEMNQNWSWWGIDNQAATTSDYQREYRKQLYRYTHDFFVGTHGFDNIVWAWSIQDSGTGAPVDPNYQALYPGDDIVDVIVLDVWSSNQPQQNWHDSLATFASAHNKVIALGEVGQLPHLSLPYQPVWKYFLCWAEFIDDNLAEASKISGRDIRYYYNSATYTKSVYNNANVLHQGQIG
ncbi:glycoside hydrolase family 26 protein [Nocardia sp. CNY236]|uniref:glycoside hydrolase family 26 protein n=1 Tax=Nocardia sp. CNY236 TaxID=1169152 RepID=UPI0018CB03EC|nr:glycosyl hydrolase [Nocardia sp. CNY236]